MKRDLKGEDQIRKLNRIDKIEIYRWTDKEVADDLYCKIGMDRSFQIRQVIDQRCNLTSLKRRLHVGDVEQDSGDYADQASASVKV